MPRYASFEPDGFDHRGAYFGGSGCGPFDALGLPLSPAGQWELVCAAEGDLLEGAARLEAIFRDPERLAQHVDSLAVRELPRRTAPLVALERRSRVSATQASRLSGGVKRMVEEYAEAMALLNEKLVHWDEAIARAEQKQKKKQQQQQQQQQQAGSKSLQRQRSKN